jgi:hypothetical protein
MLGKVKSFTTEDTEDTEFCREIKIPTPSHKTRQRWGTPF